MGMCEVCDYVDLLQAGTGCGAEPTRALVKAIEMQASARNDHEWVVAVNVTAAAFGLCGRWLGAVPGEG